MLKERRAYIELHIAVFLFGFTAILGKLISIAELGLVWWRLLITCISLLLLPKVIKEIRQISRKQLLQLGGIGWIVAMHWIFFFGAVKYSNVSVTLVCMATTCFFTAFLEPLFFKTKIKWYEVSLAVLVVPGMYFVVEGTSFNMITGIWMGLLSAFLAALFSIFNKKMVNELNPMSITFVELGSGWILLSILAPFYFNIFEQATLIPTWSDFGYLLILALLCTTLAYVISLKALKYISAFSANLTLNLEPVYGIIMALVFFQENEELNIEFYIGVAIILIALFSYPLIQKMVEKRAKN